MSLLCRLGGTYADEHDQVHKNEPIADLWPASHRLARAVCSK